MIKAGIVGAQGYAGKELIRILSRHAEIIISCLLDQGDRVEQLSQVFPEFRNVLELDILPVKETNKLKSLDVIFLALPHRVAQEYASQLVSDDKVIIDLSADFRFNDISLYEETYRIKHQAPDLNRQAVYGLPELFRKQLQTANLIAVAGCYPTGVILGLAPLMKQQFVDLNSIIADCKSGVSGAGRSPSQSTHFPECNESVRPYSIASHRHQPEIEEKLALLAEKPIHISFTPHLVPMNRGILSTIYINVLQEITDSQLGEIYRAYYQGAPFIRTLPTGEIPETRHVLNTNYCDIGITIDKQVGRLIIVTAIDNLIKGASGQAVQCMNIRFNACEMQGLE